MLGAKRQRIDPPTNPEDKPNSGSNGSEEETDPKQKKKSRNMEAFWAEKYLEKDQELIKQLRENTELAVRNSELSTALRHANNELLFSRSTLSVRGIIDHFESTSNLPDHLQSRQVSHVDKWEWIYSKSPLLQQKVAERLTSPNVVYVARLASTIYANTSSRIHTFESSRGVQLIKRNYNHDQRCLIRALCATLPCTLTEE